MDPLPTRPARSIAPERLSAIARVRTLLERAGYSADGIAAAGVEIGLGVRLRDVAVLSRALEPVEPLATLVRLFLLGEQLRFLDLERRLGRDAQALVDAGLVDRQGDGAGAAVRLTPWRELVVAHDPDPAGELWRDHVSGPNPAAETLADLTIRQQVGSALDVGTGSGLLALLASRHADRVVATDISPHALELTELNAALNEVPHLDTRLGDLFEPVAESRFDLIVSNPPYVISPETDLLFRHSPMARDALSTTVVREAATHLTEGGFAHVLCNWIQRPGDPSSATVGSWVEGKACDAVILVHGVEDPLAYAVRWNQRAQQVLPDSYAARLDEWLRYFEQQGIAAIGSGAAILRRRDGDNWLHEVALKGEPRGAGGQQLLSIFHGRDYLARTANERAMRDASFRIPAPHRLDQSLVSRDDGYVIEAASLILEEGLGNSLAVEPDLIPVLLRFDGSQTLGAIVDEVAEGTGVDRGELFGRASRFVRQLLEGGFVTAADARP